MGCEVKISEPVVSFRETITTDSNQICLSKSPNKHNRLYCSSKPLPDGLSAEIEEGKVNPRDDPKIRGRYLADTYGWDIADARRIWAFGPDGQGPNLFLDATKGVAYLAEIKESVVGGFTWATGAGPLSDEPMRNVSCSLLDVVLHADAIHRGMGQIMPTARRVINACFLSSGPALFEPMYLCEVACPQDAMGGVYSTMTRRRGMVFSEEQRPGTPMMNLRAYLPVLESFGFTAALRAATGGKAFPQCVFDHWQVVGGDPLDPGCKAGEITTAIRVRKGLEPVVPPLDRFLDKL